MIAAPCAHCGSLPVLESGELTRVQGMNFARLQCPTCPSMMMSNQPYRTKEKAEEELIRMWNTRSPLIIEVKKKRTK